MPIHSNPDVDLESQATSLDHFIPPYKLSDSGNGANGFMLVVGDESESLSHQMRVNLIRFVELSYANQFYFRYERIYLTRWRAIQILIIRCAMNVQIHF